MTSGCNYERVLNISGFRVYQVSAYASVSQGSEYGSETYSEHCQTFKMEHFAKRIRAGQGRGFLELGHFDKHFLKNKRKRDPTGKHFVVFSTRYS